MDDAIERARQMLERHAEDEGGNEASGPSTKPRATPDRKPFPTPIIAIGLFVLFTIGVGVGSAFASKGSSGKSTLSTVPTNTPVIDGAVELLGLPGGAQPDNADNNGTASPGQLLTAPTPALGITKSWFWVNCSQVCQPESKATSSSWLIPQVTTTINVRVVETVEISKTLSLQLASAIVQVQPDTTSTTNSTGTSAPATVPIG